MRVYDLTTTVRSASGHPGPCGFEPSDAPPRLIKTGVLFGTLLGPAVVVTAQHSDADRGRIHFVTDKDGAPKA